MAKARRTPRMMSCTTYEIPLRSREFLGRTNTTELTHVWSEEKIGEQSLVKLPPLPLAIVFVSRSEPLPLSAHIISVTFSMSRGVTYIGICIWRRPTVMLYARN